MADDDFDPFADPADSADAHVQPQVTSSSAAAPWWKAAEPPPPEESEPAAAAEPLAGDAAGPPADGALLPGERELRLGESKEIACLHTFPEGGEKSSWGILIVGGNPSKEFGNATMHLPLLQELCKALDAAGLRRLRFDWPGSGMSGGEYNPMSTRQLIKGAIDYMLENLCRNLVYIGYSMGSQEGLQVITSTPAYRLSVKLIVSLSTGFMVWKWLSGGDYFSSESEDSEKAHARVHSVCEHPMLYVFGEKDKMTPEESLRGFLKKRKDGGKNAKVHVVPGGSHALPGRETEVAALVASWLQEEI